MPTFRYQGRTLDGSSTSGKVDAVNSEAAAEALMNKGSFLLTCVWKRSGKEQS